MNYRSYADMGKTVVENLYKVPHDVELVVGIPRGGLLAASVMALSLNVPIIDLDGFIEDQRPRHGFTRTTKSGVTSPRKVKHTLVVDDGLMTGETVRSVKQLIGKAGISQKITYCALYADPAAAGDVDITLEVMEAPHHFEWNILHNGLLKMCCIDIDGVLCHDATRAENDDGPAYTKFLENAVPLAVPSCELGYLVTSRLEKYRKETESWLSRQGIQYKKLHMLDLPDSETRRRLKAHAEFKAGIYRNYPDAPLFVESSKIQAIQIAHFTGRPVLCFENHKIYSKEVPLPPAPGGGRRMRRLHGLGRVKRAFSRLHLPPPGNPPRLELNMQYRSYADLGNAVWSNLYKVPSDVDLVIGIPRSGLMAGSLIALARNLPLVDMDGFLNNRSPRSRVVPPATEERVSPKEARHVLVVDDTICRGKSMAHAWSLLKEASPEGQRLTSCAVYAHRRCVGMVDIYFEELGAPGCQEWNFMHRNKVEDFCLEIDDVFCVKPERRAGDDDRAYRERLRFARSLYLPTHRVGWVVTAREEKYRAETEEWLQRHGIKYKALHMLNISSSVGGRNADAIAAFKASVFKRYERSLLFVEGEKQKAGEIARLSGKTVLSFRDQEVYAPKVSPWIKRMATYRRRVVRGIGMVTGRESKASGDSGR